MQNDVRAERPGSENHRQNDGQTKISAPEPGKNTVYGAEAGILSRLDERGIKGKSLNSLSDHRLELQKRHTRLSDEELKKNRENAAKLRERQLAEARQNIDSKDEVLRLKAVSHLDTNDANDLMLLENALMADPSTEIREEAAVQLSVADPRIAVPALLNALTDPEPDVAVAVIESLSAVEAGDRSAIEAAIKSIGESHQNEEVREAATSALEAMQ